MEPVQQAVILGFESQMLGGSISIEQVARYLARKPDKYLGFAGIDPLVGNVISRIDHARSLGLVGVTISPAAQGFHPSHSRAQPLYETCSDRGMPLLVHGVTHLSAEAQLEFAQPVLLDEVARDFPKLKIIISQVGHPWIEETLVLMSKHRNVFADLSNVVTRPWQLYGLLLSAHQQGVIDRLLFGSDFPFCTPQKAITTIYSVNTLTQGTMLPSVPREQLRSIVERDVLEVLGLRRKPRELTAEPAVPAAKPVVVVATPIAATVATPIASPAPAPPSASSPIEFETPATSASANAAMDDDRSTIVDPYELDDRDAAGGDATKHEPVQPKSPDAAESRPQG